METVGDGVARMVLAGDEVTMITLVGTGSYRTYTLWADQGACRCTLCVCQVYRMPVL